MPCQGDSAARVRGHLRGPYAQRVEIESEQPIKSGRLDTRPFSTRVSMSGRANGVGGLSFKRIFWKERPDIAGNFPPASFLRQFATLLPLYQRKVHRTKV